MLPSQVGSDATEYGNSQLRLQQLNQANRDFISNRQQRAVVDGGLDPNSAPQLQQALGTMDMPAATAGNNNNNAQVGQGTAVTPSTEDAYYPNGQSPWAGRTAQRGVDYSTAPNQSDAETKRLSRSGKAPNFLPDSGLINRGVNSVLESVGLGQNSPEAQNGRYQSLQKQNPVPSSAPPATGGGSQAPATTGPILRPPVTPQSQGGAPALHQAVRLVESANNPNAVSSKGAEGAMQVMPKTQKDPGFGVRPAQDDSLAEKERVGHDYLDALVRRYGNQQDALMAYNWGPGNFDKWVAAGRDPNKVPAETRQYVQKVTTAMGGAPQGVRVSDAGTSSFTPSAGAGTPAGIARQDATAPASGPTFMGPGGPFQMPQQYDDQTIAGLRQSAMMADQALKLAQMRYAANPSEQTQQAYMAAQQQATQLKQGYYDSQIYQTTQQAQAGNMQAFKTLFNEFTSKIGTPVQLVPTGNGQYAVRTQDGQVIGQGTPHELAGAMGFSLNRSAQNRSIEIQQAQAEAMAKNAPQLAMKLMEVNADALKQAGINSAQILQKEIETGKVVISRPDPAGNVYMVRPGVGGQKDRVTRLNMPPDRLGNTQYTAVSVQPG